MLKSPNTTNIIVIVVLVVVVHIVIVEIQFPGVIIVGRVLTTRPVNASAYPVINGIVYQLLLLEEKTLKWSHRLVTVVFVSSAPALLSKKLARSLKSTKLIVQP